MAQTSVPSLTFEPTPNDSLYSPVHTGNLSARLRNNSIGRLNTYSLQDNQIHMSPSQLQFARRDMPQTPQSAKKSPSSSANARTPPGNGSLPTSAFDGPDSSESDFWYQLHIETLENFERERATWKKMTARLRHDIDSLKTQLDQARGESRHDSAFTNGNVNDKVFFDANTVNKANEKLREFSVVSPKSSASPDRTSSPVVGVVGKRYSGSARLPSITEDVDNARTMRRVSIAEPDVTDQIENPDAIMAKEDPLAPTATARPFSPPPPEYVLDAGHTPRRSSTSQSTKRSNIRYNSVAQGFDRAIEDPEEAVVDDVQDDPALNSPKMLPTIPSHRSSDMLAALNEKLEQVAEHPEDNEPEAVKASLSQDNEDAVDTTDATDGMTMPDKGIRMKKQRSLNFGTQLGQLS